MDEHISRLQKCLCVKASFKVSCEVHLSWRCQDTYVENGEFLVKLWALKFYLSDNLLIIVISESLPAEFDQFKLKYNSLKDEWKLSKMTPKFLQKEEMIMRQGKNQAFHVGSSKRKHDG